jgi:hypothetical protein
VVEHPNALVRDQYVMLVADRCRLDPATLRPLAERLAREPRPPQEDGRRPVTAGAVPERGEPRRGPVAGRGERGGSADSQRPGLEALRLAVHRPEAVAERLEPVLFADPQQRQAFVVLAEAESLHEAIALAEEDDPEVAGLLRRLTVEEPSADADDVVVQLVRTASRRALADVEAQARLSPEEVGRLAPVVARVRGDLEELDRPDTGVAAAQRLLAWLSGGEETA